MPEPAPKTAGSMKRITLFLSGVAAGLLLAIAVCCALMPCLAGYLVIATEPVAADAVIVLGGDSDGNRLREAIRLHDGRLVPRLILVNGKKDSWLYVIRKACPDCSLEGRDVVFLEGSVNTLTDLEISLAYCREQRFSKVLVVTSPYHTRRVSCMISDLSGQYAVDAITLSSGNFGKLVAPSGKWWQDSATLETVWLEFGKVLFWEFDDVL